MIQSYKDIICWKKSHELVLMVYKLTEKYPKHELFGLTSQTRRAAVSVPSNIAEGFKRKTVKDSLHFYNFGQSSLEELRYQLFLAKDLKYISEAEYQAVENLADEVARVLFSWMKSHR